MTLADIAMAVIAGAVLIHLILGAKVDDDEFEERWERILESENSTDGR